MANPDDDDLYSISAWKASDYQWAGDHTAHIHFGEEDIHNPVQVPTYDGQFVPIPEWLMLQVKAGDVVKWERSSRTDPGKWSLNGVEVRPHIPVLPGPTP